MLIINKLQMRVSIKNIINKKTRKDYDSTRID